MNVYINGNLKTSTGDNDTSKMQYLCEKRVALTFLLLINKIVLQTKHHKFTVYKKFLFLEIFTFLEMVAF